MKNRTPYELHRISPLEKSVGNIIVLFIIIRI